MNCVVTAFMIMVVQVLTVVTATLLILEIRSGQILTSFGPQNSKNP